MRNLLLVTLFAAGCGTSEASPPRAQPLAEMRDAGTDALLPQGAALPDAGLLADAGRPMAPAPHR